jgi:hypothetical protein
VVLIILLALTIALSVGLGLFDLACQNPYNQALPGRQYTAVHMQHAQAATGRPISKLTRTPVPRSVFKE